MRIAIDIDSTLHDYWEQFAAAVRRRFGVTLPYEDQVTWEVTLLRPEQVRAAVVETHGEQPRAGRRALPRRRRGRPRLARGRALHPHHLAPRRPTATRGRPPGWTASACPTTSSTARSTRSATARRSASTCSSTTRRATWSARSTPGCARPTLLHPWNRELCETEDVICAEDWPELARRLEPVLA